MDLRELLERIAARPGANFVSTYEKGGIVRRSFTQLREDVLAAADKLARLGIAAGMRVGIKGSNSYAWIVHDLAVIRLRAVSVAFTADFAGESDEALRRRYGLALMLTGAAGAARDAEGGTLIFGDRGDGVRADGPAGAPDPEFERPGLIFSSGSAGGLKGMVLNRRGVEASIEAFTLAVGPRPDDRLLLFLPLSNFQQRLMVYAALWYGFDLLVVEPVHLFRALQEMSPTILIAPPAFYEAIETRVRNLPPWKRRLALAAGRAIHALPSAALRRRLARRLFRAVHTALGGHIRLMVTGMAPIKRRTLELFGTMSLPLLETYGLIESGSVSLNRPGANRIGSVGKPLDGVRVEIAEDGEIIVHRTHPIATGYFECAEQENERTFIGGGAVATGDVGRFDEDGFLYLVGRKKEIIVTPGGEKVHPEVIEAQLGACGDVERAVVVTRRRGADLTAILAVRDPDDGAAAARIYAHVDRLNSIWRNVSIGKIVLTAEPFTVENGLLRPNLKLDRNRISAHFAARTEPA